MRRPLLSLVAATALLLAATLPVLSIDTGFSGLSTLPDRFPSKQGFDALTRDFPGTGVDPAQIVVQGDVSSAPVQSAIEELKASLPTRPRSAHRRRPIADGGDTVLVSVPVAGDADGTEATSAIRHLRADLIPEAFGELETAVLVGGATAESVDYFDIVGSWLPIVFAFVLGLSFILLTIAFRSIVIPAVAIALNLLSVGAAYGLLVLVFQKGVGDELLGFQQVDTIEAWVPLFLFSVLFGLSMDYQVFLLSRIKERYTPDRRHRRRHLVRRRLDRAPDHRRRADHHRRLRRLRRRRSRHVPADGLRRRRRPPRRRHDRPLRPRPGQHEAPRRVELVPPLLAQLAPGGPRRRTRRSAAPEPPATKPPESPSQRPPVRRAARGRHPSAREREP